MTGYESIHFSQAGLSLIGPGRSFIGWHRPVFHWLAQAGLSLVGPGRSFIGWPRPVFHWLAQDSYSSKPVSNINWVSVSKPHTSALSVWCIRTLQLAQPAQLVARIMCYTCHHVHLLSCAVPATMCTCCPFHFLSTGYVHETGLG